MGFAGLGLLSVGVATSSSRATSGEPVEFNRDIRPILGKCASCHGPASGEGNAGLRLDSFKGATTVLPSGQRAIVPFKPDESELIKRINATDYSLMPPETSHKVLSAEEKLLLHDWIAQGAVYKEHWAFVKPTRRKLPNVKNPRWARNGIDFFVLAKLEAAGLQPEPEATRETLIRRLSLDITGLPPTIEEVQSFVADKSKDAYDKLVDRLLASSRYGERMAMDWMDYARYADSNGYQADFERFQSRWRDWVIEAFNKNMPYDQFTVEQIAGDLLPNATMDQKLATAFNRNHRINTEGGVIAEEWRVETVIDRVETTSAVWLGLTAGCARCHDHKYDPLSQKDFYRLFAYFNNVPESGTGEERPVSHPPTMKAPTHAQADRLSEIGQDLRSIEALQAGALSKNLKPASAWKLDKALPVVTTGLVQRYAFSDRADANFNVVGKVAFDTGRATGAVSTSPEGFLDLGNVGDFERDRPFSFGAWIKSGTGNGAPFARMNSADAYKGWEMSLNQGRPQAHIISKWQENAIKISAKTTIPMDQWSHIFLTYDGGSKASGFRMYIDGRLVETTVDQDTLTGSIRTTVSTKIGRRTDSDVFQGQVDDFTIFDRALAKDEVVSLASTHPALTLLSVAPDQRTVAQRNEITRLWSLEKDREFAALETRRLALVSEREIINSKVPDVMIMEEMPKPRDAYVLTRGLYDKRAEKVDAGLPNFLPPLPAGLPNNRLGFAKWLVSMDNPLTSRVTTNRLWERFFGHGIVSTVEDFGTRAEYPSHPELLDFLATEFVRLRWDLKAMIKEIVTSATYRQASHVAPEKLQKDPENRLYSRGPRFRLPGEVIRDQALYVSGLMVEKLGGPSVRPVQPAGVWDETNFYGNLRNYTPDLGSGLYRRSLYTIWKRTAAPPNMLLFDVPPRETCRVRRARTDTPLQALTLMNDETFVEAARVLAQKMIREGGATPAERITYGFRRVLARQPSSDELKLMVGALNKRLTKFRQNRIDAEKLVSVGYARIDKGLDIAELASYAVTASTLLNLDETVNKS